MRIKFLIFLLILAWLGVPGETRAQTDISFSGVEIDLWPEFDRPEMLVIFNLQLEQDVVLPTEITLRIPAHVTKLHALADSVDGDKTYTREVQGQWANIRFIAKSNIIRMEYYDPSLNVNDVQRQYEFVWPVDYAISAFRLNIKLLEDVRSVLEIPFYSGPISRGDGYIYYETFGSNLEVGEEVRVSLTYSRGFDSQKLFAWGLGIIGAGLILGGVYRYSKLAKLPISSRNHRMESKKNSKDGIDGIYCHNCGVKAKQGDGFCRNCGTKLRTN